MNFFPSARNRKSAENELNFDFPNLYIFTYPAKVEKFGPDHSLPNPVVQIATPTQVVGKNIGFLDI